MVTMMRIAQFLIVGTLTFSTIDPSIQVKSVDGGTTRPFHVPGKANVLFFLSTECPISRSYAPEIQRICRTYAAGGVACQLIYEDLPLTADTVRQHLIEFGYRTIPAAIDGTGIVANSVGAMITPQAVIVDRAGQLRYRGRIDDFHVDLGKARRQVTRHDLTLALDEVLAGKHVTHPETPAVGCYITSPKVLKNLQPEGRPQ